jgi:hypothetical protein
VPRLWERHVRRPKRASLARTLAALLAVSGALSFSACSGDDSASVTAESVADEAERLVSREDLRRTSVGSPERAFLTYWSHLQYASWSLALDYFEPELVAVLGEADLVEAFKIQTSYFRSVKPTLHSSVRLGDEVVVRYRLRGAGKAFPMSISWRRSGGRWRIHYDPQLDAMLQSAVQTRVQSEIDPAATTPSRGALKAGLRAARRQSDYLARPAVGRATAFRR